MEGNEEPALRLGSREGALVKAGALVEGPMPTAEEGLLGRGCAEARGGHNTVTVPDIMYVVLISASIQTR